MAWEGPGEYHVIAACILIQTGADQAFVVAAAPGDPAGVAVQALGGERRTMTCPVVDH